MVEQHTPPARSGGSSPLSAVTVASSASFRPSTTIPARDQGRCLRPHRVCRQVRHAESDTNVEGKRGLGERLLAISRQVFLEGAHGGQPSVPGIFGHAIEQFLGAVHPGAGDPDRHPLQVGHSQIQRHAHGGLVVLGLGRRRIGPLAIFNGVRKFAAPPRRIGQEPQALGLELASLVRGGSAAPAPSASRGGPAPSGPPSAAYRGLPVLQEPGSSAFPTGD